MSGGIIGWTEGPTAEDAAEEEEQRRWRLRYAEGRQARTPGGKHLNDIGAQVYASDVRYLMFADWVSPQGWAVAAQQRRFVLQQVVSRVFDAGPDPVLLTRVHPGMTLSEWQEKVKGCYFAALDDERTEAEEFDVMWHSTGGRPNQRDEYDPDVIDRPKGRPAGLEGYRRTEGRPDRPSRIARKRGGLVSSRLARRSAS